MTSSSDSPLCGACLHAARDQRSKVMWALSGMPAAMRSSLKVVFVFIAGGVNVVPGLMTVAVALEVVGAAVELAKVGAPCVDAGEHAASVATISKAGINIEGSTRITISRTLLLDGVFLGFALSEPLGELGLQRSDVLAREGIARS